MKGAIEILNKIYHLFHLNSLKNRLRFWFTCLILLFICLSYLPFFLYGKELRENETQNSIQQMINLQRLVIEKWFDDKAVSILTISQLPDVRANKKENMKQILETFDENHTEFSNIAFINKHGVSEINMSGAPGTDVSDRLYFKEAKKGNSYVSDVLIGRQSKQDIIIFSSPVLDDKKRFQGLICGFVRLDAINKVMETYSFSKTGQTYLVNRAGRLLTEPYLPSRIIKKGSHTGLHANINTNIFRQATLGKRITQSYQDYRGMTVFGDYRWVNDNKWLIIGEITKAEVYAPFYQRLMMFAGALITVLLVGLVITFQMSKRVDRIIQQVLKGAHQIGKAQYDYRIEPSSYAHYAHELQKLCETFNGMAEIIHFQIRSVQQSEERYRALVEFSPSAIIVHQEGKIVYVNPGCVRLFRAVSEADLLGQHIIHYVHADYQEIVKERIRQLERNKPVEFLEEKYVMLDGAVVEVEVSAIPIKYMDKPAFQVIIHDISKRKEIEKELNTSQEKYRSVVESVKEVIFQTDVHGVWTFLNPTWQEITGYTIEESIGKPFLDYIHPDDREQNLQFFQSLIEKKESSSRHEVRYITKTGKYCWIELFARLTLNEQGQIIGTSGTLDDVTQRKEAEEELRASEESFRLLTEYSSDLITLHDVDGKYLYASPACKTILHYEEKELVGKDAYLFIHPDDQADIKQNHQTLLNTGYTVSTYRIRRKDGEYIWFESSVKLLSGTHLNDELKQIVVSRNISERKLAEQKLQEANEMLQRLSTIDGLTGVSNRRTFDERLEMEWNRTLRTSTSLSLIMLDIDYFKAYNDTYGHQGGDGCLQQIASVIRDTLGRSTDLLCRYGGEEFCVILPETDEVGAKRVGEKIRVAIEALEIPHAGSKILPWVTISVGTATMIPSVYTSSLNLISNADKSVYKAKNDGRNCVRSYE